MHPGENVVAREFASSKRQKARKPDNAAAMFERVIEGMAAKGPFEPDDVSIYHYGLKFVGEARLDAPMLARLSEMIPTGATLKYVDTRVGTEVYLQFGGKAQVLEQVKEQLDKRQDFIDRLYRELADYWGDLDWYEYAEFDEELYA